jgi:hypothetical protein
VQVFSAGQAGSSPRGSSRLGLLPGAEPHVWQPSECAHGCPGNLRIIPGDWGKVGLGWSARPRRSPSCEIWAQPAGFTGSLAGVRAPAKMRTGDQEARSDQKPFRAESSNSGWFRAGVNRSYPGWYVAATVYQHGAGSSGGPAATQGLLKNGVERRTKRALDPGRSCCLGKTGENLPQRRRCDPTPLACEQKAA